MKGITQLLGVSQKKVTFTEITQIKVSFPVKKVVTLEMYEI